MKKYRLFSENKLEEIVSAHCQEYLRKMNHEYEQELFKNQMYMSVLQNQINPHFLYNTLECIRGQALYYGIDDIATTVETLSRFFRYTINTKSDIVTLKDELSNINDYMLIQKYRFKDRFILEIEKGDDPNILASKIPKLTLQPIIENAINHAFTDKITGNYILLNITSTNKHINITVSDNGKGIPDDALRTLNETLSSNIWNIRAGNTLSSERHSGIALSNVNKRIKLLFGDAYGLSLSSILGIGTDVEIFIPKET